MSRAQRIVHDQLAAAAKLGCNSEAAFKQCYFQLPLLLPTASKELLDICRTPSYPPFCPSKSLDNSGMREKDVGLHSCNLRHKASIEVGLNSIEFMFNLPKKTNPGFADSNVALLRRYRLCATGKVKYVKITYRISALRQIHRTTRSFLCQHRHPPLILYVPPLFGRFFHLYQLNMFGLQISSSRNSALVCWEALLSSFLRDDLPFQN